MPHDKHGKPIRPRAVVRGTVDEFRHEIVGEVVRVVESETCNVMVAVTRVRPITIMGFGFYVPATRDAPAMLIEPGVVTGDAGCFEVIADPL